MKILLFEEFSGVHKNLKQGLLALGYTDVTIAGTGSGWRKIPGDVSLGRTRSRNPVRVAQRLAAPFLKMKRLTGHDVVQFMGPYFFARRSLQGLNGALMRRLIKGNASSFLVACGCSSRYLNAVRKLDYSPCPSCAALDTEGGHCLYDGETRGAWDAEFASTVDAIIPIGYEYALSYEGCPNLKPIIPLPINTAGIECAENKVKGRLVVFHGLNRAGFKGTRIIENALKRLKERYPNDIEAVIEGRLPLADYLVLLSRANIVIDQCFSYSYGMNAVYAMAMGKVVFSGAEDKAVEAMGLGACPVVNIRPDEDDIMRKIESFLKDRGRVAEVGRVSRQYVEDNHDSVKVAGRYLEVWKSVLSGEKSRLSVR
ncbi:MAG: glycosyltransferase [Deltaproteobacteria bacterium]|nr:glycosyltransferase [Deltaproteobacteria bacterium]